MAEVPATTSGPYKFHHFPQLDGFRGIAVIFVVAGHCLEWGGFSPFPSQVGYVLSRAGVFLFFVLSGFLITGLLQREKSEKGTIDFKRFYIRRALRLGPALLTFLFVIVILRSLGLIQGLATYEILACLLYARNFFGRSTALTHIWSLSLEEQFYLCWPGVFNLIRQKRALLVTALITSTIAIWRGLAIHYELFEYRLGIYYMRPYFRFDSILIGAVLIIGLQTNERFHSAALKFSRIVPAGVLWLCFALWTYYGEALNRSNYLTLQMLLIAAILCQLALGESPVSQFIFRNKVLGYFGKISYALYLWQEIFLVTKTPSWGILRQFPVNVFACVLLAMLSYHVIESPALRLKQHFE